MNIGKWSNACPTCFAKPGERCTQPTSNSRAEVAWEHLARTDERDAPLPREAIVERLEPGRVRHSRVIQAILPVSPSMRNLEQFTEDEARKLALQLLDVAGITDEMCQAFREGWLEADLSGKSGGRVRAGLKALVRSKGGE